MGSHARGSQQETPTCASSDREVAVRWPAVAAASHPAGTRRGYPSNRPWPKAGEVPGKHGGRAAFESCLGALLVPMVVTPEVLTPWVRTGNQYATPNAYTRISRDDQRGNSQIFEGRADSLKANLVCS